MRFPQLLTQLGGSLPLGLLACLTLAGGCETKSFLDPSELGRMNASPKVVDVLKQLETGYEEYDPRFVNASEPRPGDLVPQTNDYVIGRNDLVQVSVEGLVQAGIETTKVSRVTESGFISLPMIGQVRALGLTEAQLEAAIGRTYIDRNILTNPQVSVVTVEARARTFTISGAVPRGNQYAILASDFRLLDALAQAGGVTSETGIEYIYVIRKIEQDEQSGNAGQGGAAPGATPATQPSPDILAPRSEAPAPAMPKLMQAAPAPGAEGRTVTVEGQPMQIQGGQMVPSGAEANQPAQTGAAQTGTESTQPFEFNDLSEPGDVRVIRVPYESLRNLQLRYNLVVRPGDFIVVPSPIVGEYYVGGHVQRTGVYSLSARNITLRKAIIAAGGLDQLAIPERTEIVRNISIDKKVYSRVNLARIFSGDDPDILLKPDDEIMVGTNALAPFLAAFRSGFRITYGFGFLYDRNYYDDDNINN